MRGWDEFELEVIRDRKDNVVIVCSIENLDPMGVHTGDSVTVAPQMTLSDEAYQELRDAAIAIIRAVGVETGGSNIQFARDRETGELRVIEMNPRVSRSSALASKATGYPIAKVAAKLAVGYTLDEIPNDLTKTTPASFEPTLDYVVVKFPRFAFEKFPGADPTLGTQMKSVGEAMGIGRTFSEAFLKAFGSRELEPGAPTPWATLDDICPKASIRGSAPSSPARARSSRRGDIAPREAGRLGRRHARRGARARPAPRCGARARERACAPRTGASTPAPARSRPPRTTTTRPGARRTRRRRRRQAARRDPRLRAEPHRPGDRVRLLLRSRGPDLPRARLRGGDGQLQPGDGLDRLRHLRPPLLRAALAGGGARGLRPRAAGRRRDPVRRPDAAPARAAHRGGRATGSSARRTRRSTSPRTASASARSRDELGVRCPPWAIVAGADEALAAAARDRLPGARSALVRARRSRDAHLLRRRGSSSRRWRPCTGAVLVDRFVENAIEIDVDALCDGEEVYIGAVMQHVEEAGVHSGDSACVLPAPSLTLAAALEVEHVVRRLGPALGVVGLLNVQLAIADDDGLRARGESARLAYRAVRQQGDRREPRRRCVQARRGRDARRPRLRAPRPAQVSVKAAVLPFARFPGADPVLGPEMRSTGEVMASAADLPTAFAKAERAAGRPLPTSGTAFLSVRDADKPASVAVAAALAGLGFELVATAGTARRCAPRVSRSRRSRRSPTPTTRTDGRRPHPRRSLRPRRQHAAGERARAPTATSSARRPSSRGFPASRRSPAPRPPSTRSRTPAPSPRSRSRSGSGSRRDRERR